MSQAEQLANEISVLFGLTYRCKINLEGTINNMLLDGILIEDIKNYLLDIYDNLEFTEE